MLFAHGVAANPDRGGMVTSKDVLLRWRTEYSPHDPCLRETRKGALPRAAHTPLLSRGAALETGGLARTQGRGRVEGHGEHFTFLRWRDRNGCE